MLGLGGKNEKENVASLGVALRRLRLRRMRKPKGREKAGPSSAPAQSHRCREIPTHDTSGDDELKRFFNREINVNYIIGVCDKFVGEKN